LHNNTGNMKMKDETQNNAFVNDDTRIVKFVHDILKAAVNENVSDIHFECLKHGVQIRFRVDGILKPAPLQIGETLDYKAVFDRIKLMACLNLDGTLPQDGRITAVIKDKEVDLRISSITTATGDHLTLRVLNRQNVQLDISCLNNPAAEKVFRKWAQAPSGLFLVTGPTGSGKTTALYMILNLIAADIGKKVCTVEDPVEYLIPNAAQIAVKPGIGLTFPSAIRALLRQAPNTLLIGEIRDLETASLAIMASMTGHQVFSSLHTDDAVSAFVRLQQLGLKDYVLTQVKGIAGIRLVRCLCENCRQETKPDKYILDAFGLQKSSTLKSCFKAIGCDKCNQVGFKGRIPLIEIYEPDSEDFQLLADGGSAADLQTLAVKKGMKTFIANGLSLLEEGVTTFDELYKTLGM